jgi:hypothetical protein
MRNSIHDLEQRVARTCGGVSYTHSLLNRTRLSSSSDDPDNSRFTRALSSTDDTTVMDAVIVNDAVLMRALAAASSSIGTGVAPPIDTDTERFGVCVCVCVCVKVSAKLSESELVERESN